MIMKYKNVQNNEECHLYSDVKRNLVSIKQIHIILYAII